MEENTADVESKTTKTTARKPAAKKPATRKAATKKPTARKSAAAKKTAATRKPRATKAAAEAVAEAASKTAEQGAPQPDAGAESQASYSDYSAGDDSGTNGHSHDDTFGFDKDRIKEELKNKDWGAYAIRGVLMVLFGFFAWLAISVNFALAGVQFVVMVLTGSPNETIRRIILALGRYITDVMLFLSFETDERPFPLGKDLPDAD